MGKRTKPHQVIGFSIGMVGLILAAFTPYYGAGTLIVALGVAIATKMHVRIRFLTNKTKKIISLILISFGFLIWNLGVFLQVIILQLAGFISMITLPYLLPLLPRELPDSDSIKEMSTPKKYSRVFLGLGIMIAGLIIAILARENVVLFMSSIVITIVGGW